MHLSLKVANAVRKAYTDYQRNTPGAKTVDFVFCMRTTTDVASELLPGCDVREIIRSIAFPKTQDPENEGYVQLRINQA